MYIFSENTQPVEDGEMYCVACKHPCIIVSVICPFGYPCYVKSVKSGVWFVILDRYLRSRPESPLLPRRHPKDLTELLARPSEIRGPSLCVALIHLLLLMRRDLPATPLAPHLRDDAFPSAFRRYVRRPARGRGDLGRLRGQSGGDAVRTIAFGLAPLPLIATVTGSRWSLLPLAWLVKKSNSTGVGRAVLALPAAPTTRRHNGKSGRIGVDHYARLRIGERHTAARSICEMVWTLVGDSRFAIALHSRHITRGEGSDCSPSADRARWYGVRTGAGEQRPIPHAHEVCNVETRGVRHDLTRLRLAML